MDRYFTDACRMFFHDLERLKPHFSCDDKEKVEILKKEPEELKRYLAEKADPKKILDEYRLASNTFESSYYRSKKHVRKDPSKIYLKKLMRSVGCFVKAYTVLRAYEKAVQLSDGLDAETHVLEAERARSCGVRNRMILGTNSAFASYKLYIFAGKELKRRKSGDSMFYIESSSESSRGSQESEMTPDSAQ